MVREGEQHDILQHVSDFLEVYNMDVGSAGPLANEVLKRLPAPALQIPVALPSQRYKINRK